MDKIIEKILDQQELKKFINKEDREVYQFGLECAILKIVHIISYLLIAVCMGEVLSLLVSAFVLIPLRKKAGGYHAKSRTGCYIFSCCVVCLLCLVNKIPIIPMMKICGISIADILILLFAPVENENRELECDEKVLFNRQAKCLLFVINCMIAVIYMIGKCVFLAYWLGNGVIFAGILLLLGMVKSKNSQQKDSIAMKKRI